MRVPCLSTVLSGAGFAAGGRDIRSAFLAAIRFDRAILVPYAVFHHHYGICALRYRSAGHDLDRFARLHGAFELVSGLNFADDAKAPGHVAGAHGKSVAHGAVEGRIITVGGDILRQHAGRTGVERNLFGRGQNTPGADFLQNHRTRVGNGQGRHATSVATCIRRLKRPLCNTRIHGFERADGGFAASHRRGGGDDQQKAPATLQRRPGHRRHRAGPDSLLAEGPAHKRTSVHGPASPADFRRRFLSQLGTITPGITDRADSGDRRCRALGGSYRNRHVLSGRLAVAQCHGFWSVDCGDGSGFRNCDLQGGEGSWPLVAAGRKREPAQRRHSGSLAGNCPRGSAGGNCHCVPSGYPAHRHGGREFALRRAGRRCRTAAGRPQ